jgi:hypothetical protein
MDNQARYRQLVAHAKQLQAAGHSEPEILAAMREAWPSPIQSIKILRDVFNLSFPEAKARLHAGSAWADQVPHWESLHDALEAAFAQDASAAASPSEARGTTDVMVLFRPVGARELALIAESGFVAFPPRLPFQPIFYPVLTEAYATEIARNWNTKDEASDYHGFVLRFSVESAFVNRYPVRVAGATQHKELWIPAEDLEEFNRHIIGPIEIVADFRGAPASSNEGST